MASAVPVIQPRGPEALEREWVGEIRWWRKQWCQRISYTSKLKAVSIVEAYKIIVEHQKEEQEKHFKMEKKRIETKASLHVHGLSSSSYYYYYSHRTCLAKASSAQPGVPSGNTHESKLRFPCSTRVKHSFWYREGSPKCKVRVTSVVPSEYWPPESSKSIESGPTCVCTQSQSKRRENTKNRTL